MNYAYPDASHYGVLQMAEGVLSLFFSRQLKHSPEKVWAMLVEPKLFSSWYPGTLSLEARLGGSIEIVSGAGQLHWSGRILAWEPGHLFEHEFKHAAHEAMPQGENSLIRWELEPKEGGTLLKFSHSRLSSSEGFAAGSHVMLDRLADLLGERKPEDFGLSYGRLESQYLKWQAGSEADRELMATRIFDASPERIFRAWSQAEELALWWGPSGFSNRFKEFEFKDGGAWTFSMLGPDGKEYPNESRFEEIRPNERVVLRHLNFPFFQLRAEMKGIEGGKTLLSWRQIFDKAEQLQVVKPFAIPGNLQNLEKLAAHLALKP